MHLESDLVKLAGFEVGAWNDQGLASGINSLEERGFESAVSRIKTPLNGGKLCGSGIIGNKNKILCSGNRDNGCTDSFVEDCCVN